MALPWLRTVPNTEPQPTKPAPEPEPLTQEEADELSIDVKEEEPDVRVREYCSTCISPDGEIKCPRRHRCKTCKCYLDDDEWFAQYKK
jgi:hypothetical protein